MIALNKFVEKLRQRHPDSFVPDFDSNDGGIDSQVLFLFEKPGPMTDTENGGSGLISRDNNDPTANATKMILERIGLDRKKTLIWNSIPIWNHTIQIKSIEQKLGFIYLQELLTLLDKLKVIVLVGKKSQKAEMLLDSRYVIIKSFHPSLRVKNRFPSKWNEIEAKWNEVSKFI